MSEEQKPKDADQELSAEDLEQAAGGAVDMFLHLGTLKGYASKGAISDPRYAVSRI